MRVALALMGFALGGCEVTLDLWRPDAGVVDRPPPRDAWAPADGPVDESLVDPLLDVQEVVNVTPGHELRCDGRDDVDDEASVDDGVDEGCPYYVRECRACAPTSGRPRTARAAALRDGFALGVWRDGFMQSASRMMYSLARVDAAGLTPIRSGAFTADDDDAQPTPFASVARVRSNFVTLWTSPRRRCPDASCAVGVATLDEGGATTVITDTSMLPPALEGAVTSNLVPVRGDGTSGAISHALFGVAGAAGGIHLHRYDEAGVEDGASGAWPAVLDLRASTPLLDLRGVALGDQVAWVFTSQVGNQTPMYLAVTDLLGRAIGAPTLLFPRAAFFSETPTGVELINGRVFVVASVAGRGVMLTSWSPSGGASRPVLVSAEPNVLSTASDGASLFLCVCATEHGCSVRRLAPSGVRLGADVELPEGFNECELSAERGRVLAALGVYTNRRDPLLVLVTPEAP